MQQLNEKEETIKMLLNDLKQYQASASIHQLGSGGGDVEFQQESLAEPTGKFFLFE